MTFFINGIAVSLMGGISRDDGVTWRSIYMEDVGYPITSNGKVFASGYYSGLYLSDDTCRTWSQFSSVVSEDLLALPSGRILAGTNGGGLYLFSDNCDSLGTLNDGLTNLNVHTLAMDSLGYVYAGTDSGIFKIYYNDTLFATEVQYLKTGWNLLSLPIHPVDYNKETNYPGALSDAFEYCGNYNACQELSACKGYWLKIGSDSYFPLWGEEIYRDSINVDIGWNMIGSLSKSFPASTITSEPAGIVTSSFW